MHILLEVLKIPKPILRFRGRQGTQLNVNFGQDSENLFNVQDGQSSVDVVTRDNVFLFAISDAN